MHDSIVSEMHRCVCDPCHAASIYLIADLSLPCVLALAIAGTAYAMADERVIALKDGASVVIFQDGKMSMRDKFGRAHAMPEGTIMETADGQKIRMKGNEFWRRTTAEAIKRLYPFLYSADDER